MHNIGLLQKYSLESKHTLLAMLVYFVCLLKSSLTARFAMVCVDTSVFQYTRRSSAHILNIFDIEHAVYWLP